MPQRHRWFFRPEESLQIELVPYYSPSFRQEFSWSSHANRDMLSCCAFLEDKRYLFSVRKRWCRGKENGKQEACDLHHVIQSIVMLALLSVYLRWTSVARAIANALLATMSSQDENPSKL